MIYLKQKANWTTSPSRQFAIALGQWVLSLKTLMAMTTSSWLHESKSEQHSTKDQSTDLYCYLPTEIERLQISCQSGHNSRIFVALYLNPLMEAG